MIHRVPCRIKLVDVPHSHWSRQGFTRIAKLIGTPLKFDEVTIQFEPLKFARVQVEIAYVAPRHRDLALLAAQVFTYDIWRERNARLQSSGAFGPAKLLQGIIVDI